MAYAEWLGGSLPTEAQREFAARGTEGRKYPWGDEEPTPELVNFGGNVGDTTSVKSYPKGTTPEGVHDLAGNVWEWCRDRYGMYPFGEQADPVGSENGSNRVLRGGSFDSDPDELRSAYRSGSLPTGSKHWFCRYGVRVAWSAARGPD